MWWIIGSGIEKAMNLYPSFCEKNILYTTDRIFSVLLVSIFAAIFHISESMVETLS